MSCMCSGMSGYRRFFRGRGSFMSYFRLTTSVVFWLLPWASLSIRPEGTPGTLCKVIAMGVRSLRPRKKNRQPSRMQQGFYEQYQNVNPSLLTAVNIIRASYNSSERLIAPYTAVTHAHWVRQWPTSDTTSGSTRSAATGSCSRARNVE